MSSHEKPPAGRESRHDIKRRSRAVYDAALRSTVAEEIARAIEAAAPVRLIVDHHDSAEIRREQAQADAAIARTFREATP